MEYIKTGEDIAVADTCEEKIDAVNKIPIAEHDANMNDDANRIVDLCKTILGLDDSGFAKAIEILKNSNDPLAKIIQKILLRRGGHTLFSFFEVIKTVVK